MYRMKKKKIKTGLGFLLSSLFFGSSVTGFVLPVQAGMQPVQMERETAQNDWVAETSADGNEALPSLHALSAVLMDGKTGRILYGREENTIRPMASTTKIMTCILALEQGNLNDRVEVSSYAASMPDVQLHIRAGEAYRLEDLLYSLMLESHNDSAVAVAEHIGGSTEQFAALMNQKARDIGCEHTCFVTPNGLDAAEKESGSIHATTASDLARIMRYCVSQSPMREEFLKITRTPSRTITDETNTRSFYLSNHNALLTMLPEAYSGKTGFTSGAGYCYVAALKKDGKEFLAALLGCGWPPHKTYKWEDMRALSRYAFEQFSWYEIFETEKQFPDAEVEEGKQKTVALTMGLSKPEQSLVVLLKEGEEPTIRYEYPAKLKAPVQAGAVVGTVRYSIDGVTIAEYPVYTKEGAERIDYLWCLKQCFSVFTEMNGCLGQQSV